MRKTAQYIVAAVLVIGVLIPAIAWWADGSNRRQLVSWSSSPPKQQGDESGIRVQAESLQAIDVGAVLEMWVWRLKIDIPPTTPWKHWWLVVKKKGETAMVFGGNTIEWSDGRPKTCDCVISVTPTQIGEGIFGSEKVAIRVGAGRQVSQNPFKIPAPALSMQTAKPRFVGNQAILAVARQHGGGGVSLPDSEAELRRLPEFDSALLLELTESFDPPPITAKK
jgi:hypothetical protein